MSSAGKQRSLLMRRWIEVGTLIARIDRSKPHTAAPLE